MHDFRQLLVWQRSYRLSTQLVEAAGRFEGPARDALGDQVTRASISVPSDIAEGAGRGSEREFRRFLGIALGSAYELETQVGIARDIGLLDRDHALGHLSELGEIQRMLHRLRNRPLK
ncbi:MAG: four helix bundle protein [Actinomycetota bacterium]|nr:four helix bundle protein [Actinomycetota bacterium]